MMPHLPDMAIRVRNFNNPHIKTTVDEFVRGITDTKVSRVASIQCPLAIRVSFFLFFHGRYSASFRMLDDGLTLGWAQTQNYAPIDESRIPADVLTVRSWGLGNRCGIVTYHHDADGASTFAIALSGIKNWVVIKVKESTREDLPPFLANISNANDSLLDFLDRVDAETIHLGAGDLL